MKKKRERRIAMLLAMMMLVTNLIVSPVWAGPGDVVINETNFPDKNFRDYVVTLDGDHDGKLSGWEIARVTSIDVRYKSIADLTGIGYFTALLKLDCAYTQLSTLDTGKNTALQELNCYKSQLKSLDISKNTALQKLECSENQLTSLDISKNTALKELYCAANKLTSLDVSKNTALENLYCSRNQLKGLGVSKNTTLKELDCAENQLTSLDISKNPALVTLACSENQLTNLDLSKNTALQNLFCTRNHLTNLDLSKNTALVNIFCYNQTYDVKVKISDMKITYADFPGSFDITKATRIVGANSDFIVDATKPSTVTYNYKTGYNPKIFNVTLNITYDAYTVTFNTNGGSTVSAQTIKTGEHAQKPEDPTKDGYTFAGWYKDAGLTTPFDFANETINADITLYAKWTQNAPTSYTVTFNTNGGTAVNPQTIAPGEHVTIPTAPTKDGYTFAGWYKDAGLTKPFDFVNETINADTTIYAKWTQNPPVPPTSYTVTFNTNGGTAINPQTITAGEHVTKPTDPTKDGYTFAGWYKDAALTTAFDFATETINADTTIYAKWTQNPPPTPVTYTLTASVDGGHGSVTPTNATKNKNETITLTFTPETGYEIEEVKVNDVVTPVSGNTLTLTMDGDKTVVVKYKSTPTPPPAPTVDSIAVNSTDHKTAYKVGEPLDVTNLTILVTMSDGTTKTENVTADMVSGFDSNTEGSQTLTITYEGKTTSYNVTVTAAPTPPPTPVTYTLTASVDGGHGSVTPTNATKNKNETVTLTFTPETGYEIEEVKVNDVATTVSGNTLTLTMDGDKTVVVKYKATPTPPPTPVTYTLTASVDGGHGSVTPTNATKNKNETVTLTFTPDTGYELDTVTVNGTAAGVMGNVLDVKMNENKTVLVKFKAVGTPPIGTPVTITFDKNGGSGTMADVTKNKGESFTLPACGFTPPAGKEFQAWQVDGTEKNVGDNIVLNGDKIIKAVWKDKGSLPPTPPVPPTPYIPGPYPYPWTRYPGYWYNIETPKPKEEKPVTKMEMDWKLELMVGVSTINREINGVYSKIKMDVAPYIRDGRTMLPIRYVAEALGFDVDWNGSTRTVVLKNNSTRVEIPVDTNKIIVNGTVYTSDVKPEIKNNRTMLPIANIARALGLKDGKDIIWNSKSKMVTIYRSIVVK